MALSQRQRNEENVDREVNAARQEARATSRVTTEMGSCNPAAIDNLVVDGRRRIAQRLL